jgi:hypothetical protein
LKEVRWQALKVIGKATIAGLLLTLIVMLIP